MPALNGAMVMLHSLASIGGVVAFFAALIGSIASAVLLSIDRTFPLASIENLHIDQPRFISINSGYTKHGCIGQSADLGCALDTWLMCRSKSVPIWCGAVGVTRVKQEDSVAGVFWQRDIDALVNIEIRPVSAVDLRAGGTRWARPGYLAVEYTNLGCRDLDDHFVCEWEFDRAVVIFKRALGGQWHVVSEGSNLAGLQEAEDPDEPCGSYCRKFVIGMPVRGTTAATPVLQVRVADLTPPRRDGIHRLFCPDHGYFDLRKQKPPC